MPLTFDEAQIVAERQKNNPNKVVFVRMHRPRLGVVVFEAPQFNVQAMYENQPIADDGVTTHFAECLRTFIDEVVSEFLPPSTGDKKIDMIITDPAWKEQELSDGSAVT